MRDQSPSELVPGVDAHSLQRLVGRHSTVTLILSDSETMELPEADAVISDPPYGMDWNTDHTRFTRGGGNGGRGKRTRDMLKVSGDEQAFDPVRWLKYPKVILWGMHHYANRLPRGSVLVWLKKYDDAFGTFLSDADLAWMKGGHGVYAKRDTSLLGDASKARCHPTQKPVPLMAWCIEKTKLPKGSTILDPYMGSGTTAIACIRLGMNFIGIERDAAHYKTACDRIAHELDGALL